MQKLEYTSWIQWTLVWSDFARSGQIPPIRRMVFVIKTTPETLKEETEYLSGNFEGIIERKQRKIPSEMDVVLRFTLFTFFVLFKLLYTA